MWCAVSLLWECALYCQRNTAKKKPCRWIDEGEGIMIGQERGLGSYSWGEARRFNIDFSFRRKTFLILTRIHTSCQQPPHMHVYFTKSILKGCSFIWKQWRVADRVCSARSPSVQWPGNLRLMNFLNKMLFFPTSSWSSLTNLEPALTNDLLRNNHSSFSSSLQRDL